MEPFKAFKPPDLDGDSLFAAGTRVAKSCKGVASRWTAEIARRTLPSVPKCVPPRYIASFALMNSENKNKKGSELFLIFVFVTEY